MRTTASVHYRPGSIAALAAMLALVAACGSIPSRPEQVPPALQLIDSAQLAVPEGCVSELSVRVDFIVLETGRTGRILAPEAPACLRDALVAWVESFLYAPPGAPTEESVEWLLVTARRGS
jgi:hypothetical protein